MIDLIRLIQVWRTVLSDQMSEFGGRLIRAIVIGRRVSNTTTAVLQRVAGPDRGIGIIKTVVIRIEVPLLPRKVPFDQRPHLSYIGGVAGPIKVVEQLVDKHQVHVVMMSPDVAIWVAT